MRILLVEDQADTVRLYSLFLESLGHHVVTAGTLADARPLCQNGPLDLLIADINLPDGKGWELGTLATQRGIQAIAVSARAYPSDAARSLASGFCTHLPKPVNLSDLRKIIESIALICDEKRGKQDRKD